MKKQIQNAIEAERQRIGRDLHDSLGQSLTAIAYLATALSNNLRGQTPLAQDAQKIVSLIETAAEQTHELVRGLFPADIRTRGLVSALQDLAANTRAWVRIPCSYGGLRAVALPDENAACQLYRIAQEAVNNAVKHSQARSIRIRLAGRRDRLVLTVADNGQGIARTRHDSAGMGLRTMRRRAAMIGASLAIDGKRNGTTVTCSIPAPASVRPSQGRPLPRVRRSAPSRRSRGGDAP